MLWSKDFSYLPRYEYTSTNQYGGRYKKVKSKQVSAATLTANCDDATDLRQLILLSHHLDVPVHYDFSTKPQTAFIKIVAKESL